MPQIVLELLEVLAIHKKIGVVGYCYLFPGLELNWF